jgi:protein TonB
MGIIPVNRLLRQTTEWIKRHPIALAVAASLVLHAGTLIAAHLYFQDDAPKPFVAQTVALVVIEQDPATPAAPASPTPEAAMTVEEPAPQPNPIQQTNHAPHRPPQAKPITIDPRMEPFPILTPVFKAPPRRPVSLRSVPDTSTPVPKTTSADTNTPSKVAPIKMAKASPSVAHSSAAPLTPPRYGIKGLANPQPRYPWLARQRGEQGRVVVRVAVDRTGQVINTEIAQSSGHGRLDRAALSTLRRWRFVPARRGTAPVTATVDVPVTFRLSDN